jgi:hypothetical protein
MGRPSGKSSVVDARRHETTAHKIKIGTNAFTD